jgi:uncharacterized protein YndB with AHSA1/START domain
MDAITKHKMTLTLPSDVEFEMSRAFDAPTRLVFQAWTEPKHLTKWFGCVGGLAECHADVKVDGGFRYVMNMNGSKSHAVVFGVYREVVTNERLVHTQGYVADGFLSPNVLVTTTFTEKNGRTTLTSNIWHNSKADRDQFLATGVERGADASFDQLEAHIRTME